MENTTQSEQQAGRAGVLSNGVLVALLGMQLAVVPWILVTLLNWATDDMVEDNVALYLVLLPLLLGPLLVPLAVKLSRFPRFATFARNWLVYIGLAGQLLLDWLVYARFNGLFPFPLGEPLHTGWLSGDNTPIVIFAAWLNWSVFIVIPALVCSLLGPAPDGKKLATGMHAGLALLAVAMGLQWGGPWSMPFNHLVWVAALMAVLSLVQGRQSLTKGPAERQHFPVFSTAGMAFLVGFWFSATTIASRGAPSQAWPWLACSAASAVLLVISVKRPAWLDSRRFQACIVVAWAICCGATIALIIVNLVGWFAGLLVAWQAIGLACLSASPSILGITARAGTTRTGGRLFFAALMVVAGMLISYLLNVADPISSYAAFAILGHPILMTFTSLAKREANAGRR